MPEEAQNTNNQTETPEIKFGEWIATQDEHVRKAYENHTAGLMNTVKATRTERDEFAQQIRDLSAKAEKGSELEKLLTEATAKLDAAEKRAVFAEEANKPEIGCSNPKAAYLLAIAENLFDRKGNPDWTAIKAAAPELFRQAGTRTFAGDGTQAPPPAGATMNDFIRRSAGRKG